MSGTLTHGVAFADYLALPGAHFSALKHLDTSPLHYRRAVDHASKPSPAMVLGSITHAALLTPDLPVGVAVWDGARRGKAWEEFEVQNGHLAIVKRTELEAAREMRAAVMAHPVARELLTGGEPEVTLQWEDPNTGVDCRARIDYLRRDGGMVEVKTTRRIGIHAFASEAARYLYHAQAAFYEDGLTLVRGKHSGYVSHLVAVENVPPHDVCVYKMGDNVLEAGRRKVDMWLRTVAACEAAQCWPGVAAQAVDMILPAWVDGDGLDDVDESGLEAA